MVLTTRKEGCSARRRLAPAPTKGALARETASACNEDLLLPLQRRYSFECQRCGCVSEAPDVRPWNCKDGCAADVQARAEAEARMIRRRPVDSAAAPVWNESCVLSRCWKNLLYPLEVSDMIGCRLFAHTAQITWVYRYKSQRRSGGGVKR